MAKREFVNRLSVTMSHDFTEPQIEAICRQTPNDFDEQWVMDQLALKGTITAAMVIKTIKGAPLPKAEHCDRCRDGVVYAFDHVNYRTAQAHGVTLYRNCEIPTSSYSCPNCGKHRDRLQQAINAMNPHEQGWMFVILYDFYSHIKDGEDHWKNFNPSDYWEGIDLNPELNQHQIDALEFCYRGIMAKGKFVPDAPAKIQKLAHALANTASAPF